MNYEINLDNNKTLEIREAGRKYAINLAERLLKFAVDVIKFLFLLPFIKELEVVPLCNINSLNLI